jgi:hypothetical protein
MPSSSELEKWRVQERVVEREERETKGGQKYGVLAYTCPGGGSAPSLEVSPPDGPSAKRVRDSRHQGVLGAAGSLQGRSCQMTRPTQGWQPWKVLLNGLTSSKHRPGGISRAKLGRAGECSNLSTSSSRPLGHFIYASRPRSAVRNSCDRASTH